MSEQQHGFKVGDLVRTKQGVVVGQLKDNNLPRWIGVVVDVATPPYPPMTKVLWSHLSRPVLAKPRQLEKVWK